VAGSEDETLVAKGSAVRSPVAVAPESSTSQPSFGSGERTLLAGRYEILGLLGAGGMGTVYRARDHELDDLVALKVLRREIADSPGVVERFRMEVKLARRVTHRNVARVFDIGEHEGEKFLTMELVDGEPLSAAIAQDGAPGLERAVAIAAGIAAALAGAHQAGVVHRDLKPANVLLARDGRVVVTDFGIAHAILDAGSEAGSLWTFAGTPAYMAPEQVAGLLPIDARADIYSFGTVMYELFTGRPAWAGKEPTAVAASRLVSPPPDPRRDAPALPAAHAELVLRCLARQPDDRPASVEEVAEELALLSLPTPPALTLRSAVPTLQAAPIPEECPSDRTVAVLPFRNRGDASDDYLAEELTDDLIDALSMTRCLKVRARGAIACFRGKDLDAREIGRELGVQVVVEGSVRRARGNVRISARLVSVANGFQVWAKHFDRPDKDVLDINDEAARAVTEALTLDARVLAARARGAPSDPAAIDLYLRARHEYRKFWPDHLRRAVDLFEQAAALAPDDPLILSGMAMALSRLSFFAGPAGVAHARRVAERAVAVAPGLSEPHLALGAVVLQVGEGTTAIRELRRAVVCNPGVAEAHAALGRLLVEVGEVEEGRRRLDAALELDPQVPLAAGALMRSHALLGRWDESARFWDRVRQSEGAFSYWTVRARMALWQRLPGPEGLSLDDAPKGASAAFPRAILEVLRSQRLPPWTPTLEEVSRNDQMGARRRVLYHQMLAELAGYLRDFEQVLAALRHARDAGLIDLLWLVRCPLFDPLHADARFVAIQADVEVRAGEILAAYRTP
jgi:serine/threonine-protein kinase